MGTAPNLYNGTKILNNVYDPNTNTLATSSATGEGAIINPAPVTLNMIYTQDIDWENSDFTGWIGDPMDLFGNVSNGGIYNDSTDNPKSFTLVLYRTRTMRTFGIGTSTGFFKNIKATLLGSGDQARGVLDLSQEDSEQQSFVYSQEEFTFNSIKVEFLTADRIDVSNLFFEHTYSQRKDFVVHKFGLNPDIDSAGDETIWTLGDQYIFTETAQPYFISSSNSNDTQVIEGELIVIDSEGKYRREMYSVTLQGQTKVQIPTTNNWNVIASNRAFNTSATQLEGDIYVYEDTTISGGIPNDLTFVRSHIAVGREQTEQAVYTVPMKLENGRIVAFAELYVWSASAIRNRSTAGIFDLFIASVGQTGKIKGSRALSENFIATRNYGENTPLIVQPGSDVWLQASEITTNNVAVEGEFTIKLVIL